MSFNSIIIFFLFIIIYYLLYIFTSIGVYIVEFGVAMAEFGVAMAEIIFRTMLNPFWFLQDPRHTSFVFLIVCFFICLIPSLVTILSKLGPSASEGPPRFY